MGRHQENITRLVCSAIICAVSFCLLTCAFANLAYADYNDLPNSYTDQTGGNYNPEGILFGTNALVFTDAWYADETIFSQSLSATFQVVQDKTAIYTAIVADCVRQSNNWLSKITSSIDTVEYYIDDIYMANNQMLGQIRFNQEINGTKTLRGIISDISSAMTTNNASLQQIKDTFYDSDGYNFIGYIKSNTDYLYTINNTLTSTANGTIRDLIGDIESHTAANNILLNSILNELRSGGYIGQQLSTLNTNISSLLTAVRRVQNNFTNASGTEIWYMRDMPISSLDLNRTTQWTTDVRDALQGILSSFGSNGSIGQQLSDLNAKLTTISNNLQQYTYVDSTGGAVRYYWVASLMPADSGAQEWMTNVRNYLDNIRTYSSNLSSKIDLIRIDVSSIVNSLGSGGYIGQQLSTLNTNISSLLTAVRRVQSNFTNASGTEIWYMRDMPISSLDLNRTTQWTTDVRDALQGILSTLGQNGYIGQQLSGITSAINTLNTNVSNLLTAVRRVQSNFTNASGTEIWYMRDMPISPLDLNRTTQWTTDIRNYLQTIANKPNFDMTSTINKLNDILQAINGLDLIFNVPTNWPDIIGDFDDLDFGDKVDDLIDELENLAPFGAIFLISNQINLLTQVDPLTNPSFVMDFNFAGTSENITLDVSWLNDAKPLLNFITIFLLMYSLLIISMKYVRQEATS